jgi:serine/threonine-protein phosphatase 4 regulatory subunit 4
MALASGTQKRSTFSQSVWSGREQHSHTMSVTLAQVRIAALNGLVAWCELLPHEARVVHLLPLVRQHMQPLELELPLQRTLAAAFPRLLAAVSSQLMSCTTDRVSRSQRRMQNSADKGWRKSSRGPNTNRRPTGAAAAGNGSKKCRS